MSITSRSFLSVLSLFPFLFFSFLTTFASCLALFLWQERTMKEATMQAMKASCRVGSETAEIEGERRKEHGKADIHTDWHWRRRKKKSKKRPVNYLCPAQHRCQRFMPRKSVELTLTEQNQRSATSPFFLLPHFHHYFVVLWSGVTEWSARLTCSFPQASFEHHFCWAIYWSPFWVSWIRSRFWRWMCKACRLSSCFEFPCVCCVLCCCLWWWW